MCGEGTVEIDKSTYRPKIVVNGLLYTGEPIRDIKISRNYPLNTTIVNEEKYLADAFVTITNASGISDTLSYSPIHHFYAVNQKVEIIGGETYALYVTAEIDDKDIWTSSTTIAPHLGFSIDDELSTTGDITYLKYYVNGLLVNPNITFTRTEGAEFYGLSAVALNADDSTFIEDNIYGAKSDDLDEYMDYYKYVYYWSSPDNRADGTSKIELPWWLIYFYSPYRLILYAGDLNFYHFFVSHLSVMNIDGNLREPLFYFEGDGIGLFGSAIRDTIYFNVIE
jgi:hypothetical protein